MHLTVTPEEIRAARDKVAELALVNPMLTPDWTFERLEAEGFSATVI